MILQRLEPSLSDAALSIFIFFFLVFAQGLYHLHETGKMHRDIKVKDTHSTNMIQQWHISV